MEIPTYDNTKPIWKQLTDEQYNEVKNLGWNYRREIGWVYKRREKLEKIRNLRRFIEEKWEIIGELDNHLVVYNPLTSEIKKLGLLSVVNLGVASINNVKYDNEKMLKLGIVIVKEKGKVKVKDIEKEIEETANNVPENDDDIFE